jgi:hypothetical protein
MKVGRATTRCRESREANMDHHGKPFRLLNVKEVFVFNFSSFLLAFRRSKLDSSKSEKLEAHYYEILSFLFFFVYSDFGSLKN